jgi:hypothetical protein
MMFDGQNIQLVPSRKSSRFTTSLFLAFALLAAQAIVLQHSHADDSFHQVDCSVCIEQNKNLDALPTTPSLPSVVRCGIEVFSNPVSIISITPSNTLSRGPPLVIS